MPFMNTPPTERRGAISEGVIRLPWVARETADCRPRWRPIYQPGQSRYVGGPQNAGDPECAQVSRGGGSFVTMGQGNSGSSG